MHQFCTGIVSFSFILTVCGHIWRGMDSSRPKICPSHSISHNGVPFTPSPVTERKTSGKTKLFVAVSSCRLFSYIEIIYVLLDGKQYQIQLHSAPNKKKHKKQIETELIYKRFLPTRELISPRSHSLQELVTTPPFNYRKSYNTHVKRWVDHGQNAFFFLLTVLFEQSSNKNKISQN